MLELKRYTKAELVAILHTKSKQGLTRKLDRYGITYTTDGWGDNLCITLTAIPNKFKIFCITELDFPAQCDFYKLRNFFFYFFADDDTFRSMPDEVIETILTERGKRISRQTIAGWKSRLDQLGIIQISATDYIYYFAFRQHQRISDHAEYARAWSEYFYNMHNGTSSYDAIEIMRYDYGGVARKQPIAELNGIYNDVVRTLQNLIYESIEEEHAEHD